MALPQDEVRTAPARIDQPYGEVFDRGYRHYEGQREGRSHAIRALVRYSVKRGLGMKKKWTAKLIPFGLYVVAFIPVIVIIGLRSFLGDVAQGMTYGNLYSVLAVLIGLFAAVTAPEMLGDDRRQKVLPLYFSRALRRTDYVLAKIAALGLLIGIIAFLPAFILFLGNAFLADSPASYFGSHLDDLGRIVISGALISLFYTSIALIVSAYIDRKGIAAATTIGGVLVVTAIVSALYEAIDAAWNRYLVLLNVSLVPEGITTWLFGSTFENRGPVTTADLNGFLYLAWVLVVALACAYVIYRRYLTEE